MIGLLMRRSTAPVAVVLVMLWAVPAGTQTDPRVPLLAQAAWQALDAGQMESATTAFRDAIALDPKNPRLHVGAAVAAYALRRDADARLAIDRALALSPNDAAARELSGRLLYRAGDLNGAILVFSALSADGARGPSVAETLERWRREAELRDRMFLVVGSAVTVAFEGPEDARLAERALASLERAAARIGAVLVHAPTTPVPVVLYTSQQFFDITRSPSWAAGAFDGTIRVPMRGALANPIELDRVLAHEYAHALVHDLARRRVPAWLNEGLAAALETERDSVSAPPITIPLLALTKPFSALADREARRAYAFSAFAVQRLLDDAGGFAVANLLRDIGGGADFESAFAHRMQRTLGDFEASLTRP